MSDFNSRLYFPPQKARLEKRPPDLHLALLGIEVRVPRAADHPAGRPFQDRKRAPRLDRAFEVPAEHLDRVAIAFGVLLPDQRILRRLVEGVEVAPLEGSQLDEAAGQMGLEFEVHGGVLHDRSVIGG